MIVTDYKFITVILSTKDYAASRFKMGTFIVFMT